MQVKDGGFSGQIEPQHLGEAHEAIPLDGVHFWPAGRFRSLGESPVRFPLNALDALFVQHPDHFFVLRGVAGDFSAEFSNMAG